MSITVVEAASTRRLITLADLEDAFGIETVQVNAAAFLRLIDRASAAVEGYCGRIFAQQEYLERFRREPSHELVLKYSPIVGTPLVTSDGEIRTGVEIADADAGILYHARGWSGGYGAQLELAYVWEVQYIAGFLLPEQTTPPDSTGPALPADLQAATLEAVKVWHTEALPEKRITSRRFEDQAITYSIQAGKHGLPKLSQELLLASGWKRWVVR